MKRFLVLDSFRGLCALAVVLHHARALQSISEWGFFRHANYLVNFFFVLSGFVMCHIYADRLGGAGPLKRFVIARLCRLYPLHLAMLLAALALECVKLLAEQHGIGFGVGSFTGPKAPSEILPNLLLLQSWWAGFDQMSFNFPSWSISVEFYLYLLFALVIVALPGLSKPLFCAIAAVAFAALFMGSDVMPQGALVGLGCFFSGALTHAAYLRLKHLQLGAGLATVIEALSLLAVGVAVAYSGPDQNMSLSLLFCAVIAVFAFEAGALSTLLRTRPFHWAGVHSFSIYMTHTLVIFVPMMAIMLLGKATGHPLLADLPGLEPSSVVRCIATGSALFDNLGIALILALVLGVCALTYRYIELPGIELGKVWGRKAAGSGGIATARETAP